jgi:hypothetical protein
MYLGLVSRLPQQRIAPIAVELADRSGVKAFLIDLEHRRSELRGLELLHRKLDRVRACSEPTIRNGAPHAAVSSPDKDLAGRLVVKFQGASSRIDPFPLNIKDGVTPAHAGDGYCRSSAPITFAFWLRKYQSCACRKPIDESGELKPRRTPRRRLGWFRRPPEIRPGTDAVEASSNC